MNQPLVRNAANKEQVQDAQMKVKLQKEREVADLNALLKSPEARRFIWRILKMCGMYESSYTGSGSDTFFREGKRQIGLNILAEVTTVDPNAFLQMMKENGDT